MSFSRLSSTVGCRFGRIIGTQSAGQNVAAGRHTCCDSKLRKAITFNHARLITTSSARAAVIKSCSSPDVELPDDVSMAHYFMDDFGRYGDLVALSNGLTGEKITFADLQTQISRVASALTKAGIKKGDIITIFLPNCPEFASIFLGVTAIGAVASAVNPVYTVSELQHAVSHSESRMIFTVPLLHPIAKEAMKQCPTVQQIVTVGPSEGARPFSSILEDDGTAFSDNIDINPTLDMAALPYSSGTTGLPKGVMLSHYNLVSNLQQMRSPLVATYHAGEDCMVGVLPFFHIYGLMATLMLSLKSGVHVSSIPKFDPEIYLKLSQELRVTYMHIVPPIMLFLAKHPVVDKFDLSSVKHMLCAAAPIGPESVKIAYERLNNPNLTIRQGYGMTESSPLTHINPPEKDRVVLSSIGVTCPNTEGKVIDVNTGEMLGPNQEGEICSRGPQVMMGYFKNKEATESTVDQEGWLHSGDIGYYDEEGYFYITDRLKELIKYKGFQVAPAELEAVILTHPHVQDTAVLGIPDERAGELPRAFVVPKPDTHLTEEDVANFVKGKVAAYKELSGGVEFRNEIPKSASGKILRRVLKDDYLGK